MVQRYKLIGAFALVLCLAAVSFAIVAEDSEQADATATSDLSTALDNYAKDLLGNGQGVFDSDVDSSNGEKLVITVDTSKVNTVSLNLVNPYDNFMECIKKEAHVQTLTVKHTPSNSNDEVSYDVIVKDKKNETVLNRGAVLDLVLSVLNDYSYDEELTATYVGKIVINGTNTSDLEISIIFTTASYNVLQKLHGLNAVNIDVTKSGKVDKVYLNMVEPIAKILGSNGKYVTFDEFNGMTLIEIAGKLKEDVEKSRGVISKLFSGTGEMAFVNLVCEKIFKADGLTDFIDGVFTLNVNGYNINFGKVEVLPTVTGSKYLEGLVDTIYEAMVKGSNFDKTMTQLREGAKDGIVSFKATITWNGGEASGTVVTDQKVDVVFGSPKSVSADTTVTTGTVTIDTTGFKYCWDEITITCTPDSGYTLKSIGYSVGEAYHELTNSQIPFDAYGEDIVITAKFSPSSPPSPTTKYTVRFSPTEGGSVQPTVVIVDPGATITAEANVLKVGSNTVTATPDKGYIFKSWSVTTGTVTSNMTIDVAFEKGEPTEPILVVDGEGSVYIPADVVQTLGIKDPEKLELTITSVQPATPNVPENAVCYSVTLVYDGKALKEFSDYIDVALSFTPPFGADISKFKVYFVSDDGRIVEDMNATYDSFSHAMVFKIPHLSTFAITDQVIEPIPAVLQSISVKTAPAKVSYTTGDCFDPTGLVISLKYDDGSSLDLAYKGNESQFTFEPSTTTALKTTDKSVTITHEGKTTTQAITVSDPAPEPSSGGDNTVLIIVIVIIVILVIAAGVFFYMKKKAA